MEHIDIYTDGSSLGFTPNYIGGWGMVVIEYKDEKEKVIFKETGDKFPSTNNEMELYAIYQAILYAKEALKENPDLECVKIHSDSAYSLGVAESWVRSWSLNGWFNSKGEEVANIELVKKIWEEVKYEHPKIRYVKVKGHSGDKYNEVADDLATSASDKKKKELIEQGVLDINGRIIE